MKLHQHPRISRVVNTLLEPLTQRIATGSGCILLFHRVVDDERRDRLANVDGETPPQLLDDIIRLMRVRGYDLVDLDAAVARLQAPKSRPFVVFTFDDGYRDQAQDAYPILRQHEVPMTVYVCTDFVARRSTFWWYLLEDALLGRDVLEINTGAAAGRWPAKTLAEKRASYAQLGEKLAEARGEALAEMQCAMFGEERVKESAQRLALGWAELRRLARQELVTVACHTASHPVLNQLLPNEVEDELTLGRDELELELGQPVKHLAYPYGSRLQVGEREFAAAKRAGFSTATTTRIGHLFPAHRHHLMALPRLYASRPDLEVVRGLVGGVTPWLRHRGRPFVTA